MKQDTEKRTCTATSGTVTHQRTRTRAQGQRVCSACSEPRGPVTVPTPGNDSRYALISVVVDRGAIWTVLGPMLPCGRLTCQENINTRAGTPAAIQIHDTDSQANRHTSGMRSGNMSLNVMPAVPAICPQHSVQAVGHWNRWKTVNECNDSEGCSPPSPHLRALLDRRHV